MKLCYFYSDITLNGGIERVLSILSTAQSEDPNLDITIVSSYKTNEHTHFHFPKGIQIVYLSDRPYGGTPKSYFRLYLLLKNLLKIRRYFRNHNYDIILSLAFPNTFLLFMAFLNPNIIISAEHTFSNYYRGIINRIRLLIYRRIRAVVVLTESDKEYFLPYLKSIFYIPNPVCINNRFHSLLDTKRIISIGRLEVEKGHDTLLRVFRKIHMKYPDWSLHIYGDGSQKYLLQQYICHSNLQDCCHLEGITNDVYSKLRESAFLVLPSHYEGFSMVLVEAMSQGVPCVSFNCPHGPASIIDNMKDGLLVKDQDETDLYNKMEILIKDYPYRKKLGSNAFEKITKFDIKDIVALWRKLYIDLGVYYQ